MGQKNYVRDKSGKILYYTELKSSGRLEVRGKSGRLLGYCKKGETPGLLYQG
jgi:hypothetical protein